MTEQDIILKLANYPPHLQRYELMIPNVYVTDDNESDFFAIRKSGLCDEFEIKVSRSDFLVDKKKTIRHRSMTLEESRLFRWNDPKSPNRKPKYQALCDGDLPANYFWYVLTEGIVESKDIPPFAGVIMVEPSGRLRVDRNPKKLHKEKPSYEQRYKIARKTNYRYWDLKNNVK